MSQMMKLKFCSDNFYKNFSNDCLKMLTYLALDINNFNMYVIYVKSFDLISFDCLKHSVTIEFQFHSKIQLVCTFVFH